MNVDVRKISDEQTIIKVQTNNGIKDLTINKTEFGWSYTDFAEWDISDEQYYDLEELVDNIGNEINGKRSSLNVTYGGNE